MSFAQALQRTTSGHFVHFYEDETSLQESVAEFIGSGLAADDAAVVIATAAHWQAFSQRLETRGHSVDREVSSGRIHWLDAQKYLAPPNR